LTNGTFEWFNSYGENNLVELEKVLLTELPEDLIKEGFGRENENRNPPRLMDVLRLF
jgi:hypothetical protein